MAAIDFPASPTEGDLYDVTGVGLFVYERGAWRKVPDSSVIYREAWTKHGTFPVVNGNTSLDITGLPPDLQEIYVSIDGISTSAGTNMPLLQFITSGGVDSTGYVSRAQTNTSISEQTTGMAMFWTSILATEAIHGDVHIFCVDSASHYYKCSGLLSSSVRNVNTVGYVTLDSVLTGIRYLVPASVFDAGSISVFYR